MAESINEVRFSGNAGRAAELRYLESGRAVATFSIAVTELVPKSGGDRGEWKEQTFWLDVTVWGEQAESVAPRVVKGRRVTVAGKLRVRDWRDDGKGTSGRAVEVVAQTVSVAGPASAGEPRRSHQGDPRWESGRQPNGGEPEPEEPGEVRFE